KNGIRPGKLVTLLRIFQQIRSTITRRRWLPETGLCNLVTPYAASARRRISPNPRRRLLARFLRRERGDDLLEARIAAERVPQGERLEHAVAGARRRPDSGLNDGAQLLDGEIFLARPRRDHGEIGAHYLPIERVARNRQ